MQTFFIVYTSTSQKHIVLSHGLAPRYMGSLAKLNEYGHHLQ